MIEPSRLYGHALREVGALLAASLLKSGARHTFLLDMRGAVILQRSAAGAPPLPSRDALVSLVAATYSATSALGNLSGNGGFREASPDRETGAYVAEIGDEAVLLSLFGASASPEQVRDATQETVAAILAVMVREAGPALTLQLEPLP